jgi:hypothetical protein
MQIVLFELTCTLGDTFALVNTLCSKNQNVCSWISLVLGEPKLLLVMPSLLSEHDCGQEHVCALGVAIVLFYVGMLLKHHVLFRENLLLSHTVHSMQDHSVLQALALPSRPYCE